MAYAGEKRMGLGRFDCGWDGGSECRTDDDLCGAHGLGFHQPLVEAKHHVYRIPERDYLRMIIWI